MKKINLLLRKCKSLSRQLARSSSSYSNSTSKSTRENNFWVGDNYDHHHHHRRGRNKGDKKSATIFVGSSKKRYIISSKYLSHPLFEALIDKSHIKSNIINDHDRCQDRDDDDHDDERVLVVKCEVVLFDHLLWMLENADPVSLIGNSSESLEELAALYVF